MSSILRLGARRISCNSACIRGPSNIYDPSHEGGYKIWRNIALFVFFPAVGACMVNCFANHEEEEQPKFIPYQHLRIRNKKYHFGDGVKTFFHNPRKNALPDGYEDVD